MNLSFGLDFRFKPFIDRSLTVVWCRTRNLTIYLTDRMEAVAMTTPNDGMSNLVLGLDLLVPSKSVEGGLSEPCL